MQPKLLILCISISIFACLSLITGLPINEESSETTTITTTLPNEIETTTQNQEEIPKQQRNSSEDDAKPKKSVRNYPIYYVDSKVNGKFGKSVRAFSSEEFMEIFFTQNSN